MTDALVSLPASTASGPSPTTGPSAGTTSPTCWPMTEISSRPSISTARALNSVMAPKASRPIMPADTPSTTASVNCRRFSLVSLA